MKELFIMYTFWLGFKQAQPIGLPPEPLVVMAFGSWPSLQTSPRFIYGLLEETCHSLFFLCFYIAL